MVPKRTTLHTLCQDKPASQAPVMLGSNHRLTQGQNCLNILQSQDLAQSVRPRHPLHALNRWHCHVIVHVYARLQSAHQITEYSLHADMCCCCNSALHVAQRSKVFAVVSLSE